MSRREQTFLLSLANPRIYEKAERESPVLSAVEESYLYIQSD
jgi:hypothetical protein